uniref:Uncharacterized protein n=1 Tax=Arundo donax TaxID=35708 RepID=A0A0A9CNX7_ARUDO
MRRSRSIHQYITHYSHTLQRRKLLTVH